MPQLLAFLLVGLATQPSLAGVDSTGYNYGADSNGPTPSSSPSDPYVEPGGVGGAFGGYVGEIGGWWTVLGCTGYAEAYDSTDVAYAQHDWASYGDGVGAGGYWWGAGPGLDPSSQWNTTTEAYDWGVRQANTAIAVWKADSSNFALDDLFLDVEESGIDGWTHRQTGGCSPNPTSTTVSHALARATFNGFATTVDQSGYALVGVYSSNHYWSEIMGTGSYSTLNLTEWTANYSNCLTPGPQAWTQTSSCGTVSAIFFGSETPSTSACPFMWQWYGGTDDYDQFHSAYEYKCN